MFCPKCGKQISDDAQFCTYCGAKVAVPPSTEPIQDQRKDQESLEKNANPPDSIENNHKATKAKTAKRPKTRKKTWLWIIIAVLVVFTVVIGLGMQNEDTSEPSPNIDTVKNGHLGEYTDITVSALLDAYYCDVIGYEPGIWDAGETEDGKQIVEVRYAEVDEVRPAVTIQFTMLDSECFHITAYVDPSEEIQKGTDLLYILNRMYFMIYGYLHPDVAGDPVAEPLFIWSLDEISASAVNYGASADYSGDRALISAKLGEDPLDVSVAMLLDHYGFLNLEDYLPEETESVTEPPETVPPETDPPATEPPETEPPITTQPPTIDYSDLADKYTFGNGYTVELGFTDNYGPGEYWISITFDLESNGFLSDFMIIGQPYHFDGTNSTDEGVVTFTIEGDSLWIDITSERYGRFHEAMVPWETPNYSAIDVEDYFGTYYSPSNCYTLELFSAPQDGMFTVTLSYIWGTVDGGLIYPGEQCYLDGGAIITVTPLDNGNIYVVLYSAITADGNYDEELSR